MGDEMTKIRESNFIYEIVQDPANPPRTILLAGFCGKASQPDCTRLYLDPQLTAYVDVANGTILHHQELSPEQSPLGGYYVWIERTPELVGEVQQAYARVAQEQQELLNATQAGSTPTIGQAIPPGWPNPVA